MSELARTQRQIGTIIQRTRKKRGWTQSQLAERAGLRQETISMIEIGEKPTKLNSILAVLVFFAVPAYGIRRRGLKAYLRQYARPTVIMLPFNIIGEFSRTLALAVRLFGNVMSAALIGAVLLGLAPVFFPVVMQLFGLLTGLIQAYIFAVLAMVYIASGMRVQETSARRHAAAADRGSRQGA